MVSLGHLWSLGSSTEIIPNKVILYSPIGLSPIPLFLYILFIIKSILYYIKKRGWLERSDNSTKTCAFAQIPLLIAFQAAESAENTVAHLEESHFIINNLPYFWALFVSYILENYISTGVQNKRHFLQL
jgi:hypothetical protein